MKDLNFYANKSLNAKASRSLECDLTLEVDGEKFRAYEVSVANRDLLFFTDKGVLNYLVDTYGDKMAIELFNVERDEEDNECPYCGHRGNKEELENCCDEAAADGFSS